MKRSTKKELEIRIINLELQNLGLKKRLMETEFRISTLETHSPGYTKAVKHASDEFDECF